MSKTFDGLTKAQDQALTNVALGGLPRCSSKTLEVLIRRGLVVLAGVEVVGRDCFGPIEIQHYEMPTWEHMRWCQSCSDNISAGGGE